jgi:hypothetical protein
MSAASVLVAPSEQEIFARTRELISSGTVDSGTDLAYLSAETLTGAAAEPALVAALDLARQGNNVNSHSWPLWEALALHPTLHNNRAAVLHVPSLGTYAVSRRVVTALAEAVAQADRGATLITTAQPYSTVWDDGPTDWLRFICPPLSVGALTRARFAGMLLTLTDMAAPTEGSELRAGSHIIGWAHGNKIWLRFHPFLSSRGRLSSADAARRIALLRQVLALAQPHLSQPQADESEHLDAWQTALRVGNWSIAFARVAATAIPVSAQDNLQNRHERAQTQVADLETQLALAREIARTAEDEALAIPSLKRARALLVDTALANIDEQLQTVRALPQVHSVDLTPPQSGRLQLTVTTQPLIVDCGSDGLIDAGSVTFSLPVQRSGDPILSSVHPAGQLDWTPVSLPLAQAIGSGDLRSAIATVCGVLARPLAAANVTSLPRAPADARPGYVNVNANAS